MGVFSSMNHAKSSSEVESSLWAVLRRLWKGAAGKQAPGLLLALPGALCDPGQVLLLFFALCHGSLSQFGK